MVQNSPKNIYIKKKKKTKLSLLEPSANFNKSSINSYMDIISNEIKYNFKAQKLNHTNKMNNLFERVDSTASQ